MRRHMTAGQSCWATSKSSNPRLSKSALSNLRAGAFGCGDLERGR